MVALRDGDPAAVRTIDSFRQLRLDQSSEVIRVARSAEVGEISPAEAISDLQRSLGVPPRFGTVWYIASHALLTLGLGWVIGPASGDFWWYLLLGGLVGAMKACGTASVGWSADGARRRGARFVDRVPGREWKRQSVAPADHSPAGHVPARRAPDHGVSRPPPPQRLPSSPITAGEATSHESTPSSSESDHLGCGSVDPHGSRPEARSKGARPITTIPARAGRAWRSRRRTPARRRRPR